MIAKRQAIEIPDFFSKENSLTIQDILTDPDISVLSWNEITILEAIGKGASGLVSKGIWKK